MPHRMYKYRLYPSKSQTKILEEKLELCRTTHNYLLNHCKQQKNGNIPTQFDLNKLLTTQKRVKPELFTVHSQVLQNIAKRIKDAYTNFYARRKAGLKAGLPRFKKPERYRSITYPQYGFQIEGKKLRLSKIGNIRIRQHREIRGQVKTLTVKRMPSGKWYACFSCLVEMQSLEKPFKDVGVDVGLYSYAVFSDGNLIENPRYLRKEEKKLARLQRRLSRKRKGSRNGEKCRVKVARLHEKIENRRNDFLHKASRQIADTYETVYVEDLRISNMVYNHCLAKSISDASWGRFAGMIAYKAEGAGGRLIKVNPRNTSQLCSQCGEIVKKNLSIRLHECPACGLVMDRDRNGALNVLKRGREIGREPPELTPEGEFATTQPLEVVHANSMNQEASQLVGR